MFSLLRTPALQALLLQGLAFFLSNFLLAALAVAVGWESGIVAMALTQGAIAAGLSYWRRLAAWWLPIQFLFPIALVAMQAMHLPPLLFLVLFVLLLLLYWSTFRTQVPFYPSNPSVWKIVADLLPPDRPARMIDIGSGFGGLVLHLAALRPESGLTGIELAPLPWLVSLLRARWQKSRAEFVRGDYAHLDFAHYDLVFAYLSPVAMPALWKKAHSEMRPGSLLLSYEFAIPNRIPDLMVQPVKNGPTLYGWRM